MRTIAILGHRTAPDDWLPLEAERHGPRLVMPPDDWPGAVEPITGAVPDWLAGVDAIFIGGALARRAETGRWAARAGKPLYIELPVATVPATLDLVAAAARAAGIPLTPVACLRHQPFAVGGRQALGQSRLGAVRFAHLTLIQGQATADATGQSDFPLDEVANALDLLTWFVDDVVRSVFARRSSASSGPGPDIVSMNVQFAGGAQAICEVGRAPGLDAIGVQRAHLIGERGAVWHDRHRGDLVVGETGGQPLSDHRLTALLARLAAEPTSPAGMADLTLDECRRGLLLALAAGESLQRDQPVTVGG